MSQSLRYITWSTLFVVLAATGCAEISKKAGVENRWRDQNIVLREGVTTQQEVLAQLGPPSQIIALPAKMVFYYLLPCCVLPFVVSVCYPQALSHTPSRERGNA